MDIQHMTPGHTLAWALQGTMLTLGANEAVIDLAECQRDNQAVIDLRARADGRLSEAGDRHAATIIIPPRRYTAPEPPQGEEEEGTGPVAIPLDTEAVTLQLWAIPAPTPEETEE